MNFKQIDDIRLENKNKVYENFNSFYEEQLIQLNKKDITILHINIKSLSRNTFNMLQVYIEKILRKIDIIAITEINCSEEEMVLYEMNNYKMNYYCRKDKKGGGILIYHKESSSTEIINTFKFKHAENLEMEINKKIVLNAIYRPPNRNTKEFIMELNKWLKQKRIENKDIIIIGDININTNKITRDKKTI